MIAKTGTIVDERFGVVASNCAERCGMVALKYRDKSNFLGAVLYTLVTDLALLHVNQIVFERIVGGLELGERDGGADARLDDFGHFKEYICRLMGMPVTDAAKNAWRADATARAAQSESRHSEVFARRRVARKKALRLKRNGERKDARHTY